MDNVIYWVITFCTSLTGGIVLFLLQRFFNDQRKKEEKRQTEETKNYVLILRSLKALGKLTVANSIALRDGRTNGEMSSALSEYEDVEKELYEHLISCHADKKK